MRVSPIIGRAGGATKTYAEFQAYVAAQATSGDRSWTAQTSAAGSWRWTAAAAGGAMVGSSWGPSSPDGFQSGTASRIARIVQHGLPSEAIFNGQVSDARQGLVVIENVPYFPDSLPSVNRNGFSSSSGGSGLSCLRCTRLDYFDPALGPMTLNPSTGAGATPFTW